MEYYIKVDGRAYQLPARTLEVDEAIDRIIHGRDRLSAGEITLRELREEQYAFVSLCGWGQLPPIEETDMNDLEFAALDIANLYNLPVVKATLDTAMGTIREITQRPELMKLLSSVSVMRD